MLIKKQFKAYYNAGSAALVLVLIAAVIGAFLWWRSRRARRLGLGRSPPHRTRGFEEHIPLTERSAELDDLPPSRDERDEHEGTFRGRGKGKERATEYTPKEEIFRVDDSDDEDTKTPRTATR